MIDINYSKINQDILEEYYSKFLIGKEKCKKELIISKIIIILGCLISVFVLFPLVCLCLIWVVYIFLKQDVKLAIMLCVPFAVLFTYKGSGIVLCLAEKLCPLAERYRIEQNLKKKLQRYNQFFEFQDILRNKENCRVIVDKEFIKVKYTKQNGVSVVFELNTMKYNSKIITETGLDFSWLDKEIENLVIERTRRTMNGVLIFIQPKDIEKSL